MRSLPPRLKCKPLKLRRRCKQGGDAAARGFAHDRTRDASARMLATKRAPRQALYTIWAHAKSRAKPSHEPEEAVESALLRGCPFVHMLDVVQVYVALKALVAAVLLPCAGSNSGGSAKLWQALCAAGARYGAEAQACRVYAHHAGGAGWA